MELEPEPELFKSRNWNLNWNHIFFKSRNRNRNHNFSKVGTGTGTVKNSYGSTTLFLSTTNGTYQMQHLRSIIPCVRYPVGNNEQESKGGGGDNQVAKGFCLNWQVTGFKFPTLSFHR